MAKQQAAYSGRKPSS